MAMAHPRSPLPASVAALLLSWGALALVAATEDGPARIELVETFPVETDLDQPDLRETHEVWRELFDGAQRSIDLAQFYASDRPGSRLSDLVVALEEAAGRGVRVRFLAEARFHETYPETLDRLDAVDGIEVRLFQVAQVMGGVLHAKYLLVDDSTTWIGSQNFDWRSLEHIQELGARVESRKVTATLRSVFDADWALAGGASREEALAERDLASDFPEEADWNGNPVRITPLFSPRDWLPDERLWDLPRIVELVDGARERVRVQLLTYRAVDREGRYFDVLESALRRAAARGVAVELLLADWGKRRGTIEGLQSLQALEGVEVRLATVPPASEGFVPFARVIHAKYAVVDGRAAWIGTSNWERGYFHESRNVSLLVEGEAFGARLDEYFEKVWSSELAETVDPGATYEPPRIGE